MSDFAADHPVTIHETNPMTNMAAASTTWETSVGKMAAWVPVTRELLDDAQAAEQMVRRAMRRLTHPWEFPDRNPFPAIDPTPRFTRWLSAYRNLRQRIRDARSVLRHGLPESEDW